MPPFLGSFCLQSIMFGVGEGVFCRRLESVNASTTDRSALFNSSTKPCMSCSHHVTSSLSTLLAVSVSSLYTAFHCGDWKPWFSVYEMSVCEQWNVSSLSSTNITCQSKQLTDHPLICLCTNACLSCFCYCDLDPTILIDIRTKPEYFEGVPG